MIQTKSGSMWLVKFTKEAEKDKQLLKRAGLAEKAKKLLKVLSINPYQIPPSYEKLVGNLKGYYSRRINIQHRIVYRILDDEKIVVVHAMWTHYEK